MLLFEKDFPNMAAARYEQNEDFFVKMFSDPDMMRQVMETVGAVLYERLKNRRNRKMIIVKPLRQIPEGFTVLDSLPEKVERRKS